MWQPCECTLRTFTHCGTVRYRYCTQSSTYLITQGSIYSTVRGTVIILSPVCAEPLYPQSLASEEILRYIRRNLLYIHRSLVYVAYTETLTIPVHSHAEALWDPHTKSCLQGVLCTVLYREYGTVHLTPYCTAIHGVLLLHRVCILVRTVRMTRLLYCGKARILLISQSGFRDSYSLTLVGLCLYFAVGLMYF